MRTFKKAVALPTLGPMYENWVIYCTSHDQFGCFDCLRYHKSKRSVRLIRLCKVSQIKKPWLYIPNALGKSVHCFEIMDKYTRRRPKLFLIRYMARVLRGCGRVSKVEFVITVWRAHKDTITALSIQDSVDSIAYGYRALFRNHGEKQS